ncbi:hypothetical protein [Deinococcus alpinitundrae]|uniref:hypothetical protein n=1 Tax=Deinococcus alpinitundrae TaxID=468913 RepID=UPI00192A5FF2|nr:hypothetical protein [Deinococcus alpinitundrae]
MKHENNRRYSHKIWLLGALMLPLAGCGDVGTTGSAQLPTTLNIGISVNDSASAVTVTKTVTSATAGTAGTPAIPAVPGVDGQPGTPAVPAVPGTPGTPAKTTWTTSKAGAATFVFTSRPGSDAGYITSYRIVSDVINGQEMVNTPVTNPNQKLNIYVPSGYSCPTASAAQSCDAAATTSVLANGVPTEPLSIDFASPLSDVVIASNASAYRSTEIEFLGTSSRGKTFVIKTEVSSVGYKAGDE